MDREVYFRVYDHYSKKILGLDITLHNILYGDIPDGIYENGMPNECLIFDQYTRLNDKHGNPIYVGDIVKVSLLGGQKLVEGVVKQVSGGFQFESEHCKGTLHLGNPNDYEIIGNIHTKGIK